MTTISNAPMTIPTMSIGARPVDGGVSGVEVELGAEEGELGTEEGELGTEAGEEFRKSEGNIGIIDFWALASHLHWETEKLRRS